MEGPSDFLQLIQSYIVIAVGILAVIVMFDSKTRRSQESRLALILGNSGCPQMFDPSYLKSEAGKLSGDAKRLYSQGKKTAAAYTEGMGGACCN